MRISVCDIYSRLFPGEVSRANSHREPSIGLEMGAAPKNDNRGEV